MPIRINKYNNAVHFLQLNWFSSQLAKLHKTRHRHILRFYFVMALFVIS